MTIPPDPAANIPTPGGQIQRRTLRLFFLLDCSGSMLGAKIDALNHAMREVTPVIRDAARQNPHINVELQAIKFANRAEWHIGPAPVPIDQVVWTDLTTGLLTATASAIRLLSEQLATDKMPNKGVPPVCILISDGECSDSVSQYDAAIDNLVKLPWGAKAIRLAIGIKDRVSSYNHDELMKFVSHKEIGVLEADSAEKLVGFIRWASTTATKAASAGKSATGNDDNADESVHLPTPPTPQQVVNVPTGNIAANTPF